jgi:hypothetical protein
MVRTFIVLRMGSFGALLLFLDDEIKKGQCEWNFGTG